LREEKRKKGRKKCEEGEREGIAKVEKGK